VHGYHPAAEDAEIYLPGVEKLLHPELFPFNTEFFESHAHLTLFPDLMAASVRVTHLSLDTVLFLWQFASIFLLLLACRQLIARCFSETPARWAGVAVVAALLTLPVAGTALYLMDQYINPRNLAAFLSVFAVNSVFAKRYGSTVLFLAIAAVLHPLMAFFALSYCVLLVWMKYFGFRLSPFLACLAPLGALLPPASAAYHQATLYHPFHYIQRWHWYEWLGIVGPIPILWWFSRMARAKESAELDRMCRGLIIYDCIYFAGALFLSLPARFESLARLQPLRSLHLLYLLMFLFAGGFLGGWLKTRAWRWVVLFAPLCLAMLWGQLALFPQSGHIECSRSASKNQWVEAFVWVRLNTPVNAIFALDPLYLQSPGEDAHGFRAIAERSSLADALKDSGAVTMFPPLADEWLRQVQAESGWRQFQLSDFQRLQRDFGVNWIVVQGTGISGITCPFRNGSVSVCRLD